MKHSGDSVLIVGDIIKNDSIVCILLVALNEGAIKINAKWQQLFKPNILKKMK